MKEIVDDVDKNLFIISPFSSYLNIFDFFTCNLIIYECIMLPFMYTFGQEIFSPRAKSFAMAGEYIIKFFFTIDVVLGFRKAFIV